MREVLLKTVYEVCAAARTPVSRVRSPVKNNIVARVRRQCMDALVARHRDLTVEEFKEMFSLSDRQARHWMTLMATGEERAPDPWPKTPAQVLNEHLAALHPGTRAALFSGVRTRGITAVRWALARAIDTQCPGISVTDIARLLKIDRTSVLYALGKLSYKRPRTSSAPDQREQKQSIAA